MPQLWLRYGAKDPLYNYFHARPIRPSGGCPQPGTRSEALPGLRGLATVPGGWLSFQPSEPGGAIGAEMAERDRLPHAAAVEADEGAEWIRRHWVSLVAAAALALQLWWKAGLLGHFFFAQGGYPLI